MLFQKTTFLEICTNKNKQKPQNLFVENAMCNFPHRRLYTGWSGPHPDDNRELQKVKTATHHLLYVPNSQIGDIFLLFIPKKCFYIANHAEIGYNLHTQGLLSAKAL